ncbi:MAG: hypothetical protein DME25_09770, partial [Verrucomicrobia bacterium]
MPAERRVPALRPGGLHRPAASSRQIPLATQSQLPYRWTTVKKPVRSYVIVEGRCAGPKVCPLSRVQAGTVVCIKQLSTAPDVTDRLRELGFREEQQIKLLARDSNFICLVCNA